MDFALGVSNPWGQTSVKSVDKVKLVSRNYGGYPHLGYRGTTGHAICTFHERSSPTSQIPNTFTGIKKFTNEKVRLTTALALINQQLDRIKRVR